MKINGLRVIDPKTPVVIHILPKDVAKGQPRNPSSCAAAVACKREVAGCTDARVHLGRTYLKMGDKWLRFRTPRPLRTEIVSVDRGAFFQPGTFRLEPLSPSDRVTGKRQGGADKPKVRTAKKRVYRTVSGVRQSGANR